MGIIKESFMAVPNKQMEENAIQSILLLFTRNWENTSTKSDNEIMALVLDSITNACDVVPIDESNEEAKCLEVFNKELTHYANQLRGQEAATIRHFGNNLQSCIKTLEKINSIWRTTPEFAWQSVRLQWFIDELQRTGNSVGTAYKTLNTTTLIGTILIVMGSIFLFITLGDDEMSVAIPVIMISVGVFLSAAHKLIG